MYQDPFHADFCVPMIPLFQVQLSSASPFRSAS